MSRALRMSVLTRICDLSRFFGSKNELQYVILPILQNPQQLIIDLEAHGRAGLKSLRCRVKWSFTKRLSFIYLLLLSVSQFSMFWYSLTLVYLFCCTIASNLVCKMSKISKDSTDWARLNVYLMFWVLGFKDMLKYGKYVFCLFTFFWWSWVRREEKLSSNKLIQGCLKSVPECTSWNVVIYSRGKVKGVFFHMYNIM